MNNIVNQFALAVKSVQAIIATDAAVRKAIGAFMPEIRDAGQRLRFLETERADLCRQIMALRAELHRQKRLNEHLETQYREHLADVSNFIHQSNKILTDD